MREKILDDVAKLAGGTVGALSGAKQNIEAIIRSHIDNLAQDLDLVPREDFEKLEAMLSASRQEQDDLKLRIKALEDATQQKKK